MHTPSALPITTKQLTILVLIYRFRFLTTKHIQQVFGYKYIQSTQHQLTGLLELQYIARHYSAIDRLHGRYASYYLQPAGIKLLRQYKSGVKAAVLHAQYKDKNASPRFIRHCLAIADIHSLIVHHYGEKATFFTKSELTAYEYLLKPLPDVYLTIENATKPNAYFVEICEDNVDFFIHERRVRQYIAYSEAETWQVATGLPFPHVILVVDTDHRRQKFQQYCDYRLERTFTELALQVVTKAMLAEHDFLRKLEFDT